MASEYQRMLHKIGATKRRRCGRAGRATTWTFKHSVREAGLGLLGHYWHIFVLKCDHCDNFVVLHREKRSHG